MTHTHIYIYTYSHVIIIAMTVPVIVQLCIIPIIYGQHIWFARRTVKDDTVHHSYQDRKMIRFAICFPSSAIIPFFIPIVLLGQS